MPVMWLQALTYPLPLLAIPIAVLIGQRMRGGVVTSLSGGAALVGGVFWLALRGGIGTAIFGNIMVGAMVTIFSAMLAVVLLASAWAVALAEAFRERQWGWIVAQCLTVYLSFAAAITYLNRPYYNCYSNPNLFMCGSINQIVGDLLIVCTFAGPLVLLIYALRPNPLRHTHAPPDDLVISRLDAE